MRAVRSAFYASLAATALAMTACGDGPPSSSGGASSAASAPIGTPADAKAAAAVTIQAVTGLKFDPTSQTVKVGQIVQWKNADSAVHNVTFSGHDEVDSTAFNPGDTWSVKFTVPGDYSYSCTIHAGMDGKLKVTA